MVDTLFMDELDDPFLLSRRQFLQRLGVATGAALGAGLIDDLDAFAGPAKRLRVIVIGAGLAGLCAAYELEQRGHTVILLEAEERHCGGRVRTHHFKDGVYGELGAMRIPHNHDLPRRYIKRFGLTLRPFVQFNPEAYYYVDGVRKRIKNAGRLNRAYTQGMERREGTIWAQPFDEIAGGMDKLPAAFATRLRNKPRFGCAVVRLEQNAGQRRVAAIYEQRGASAKPTRLRVEGDFVICTIPLPVLRRVEFAPTLSTAKRHALNEVDYLAADKTLLLTARRFWETDDRIFGGGTYSDLPTGVSYYPSDNARARDRRVSSGPGVLLASYTIGRLAQQLAKLPPDQRSALVVRELKRIHPQLGQTGTVRETESWSWGNHKWTGGGFAAPGMSRSLHRQLVEPAGRIYFAGEHTSLVHTWMQGALESALRAVRQILSAGSV